MTFYVRFYLDFEQVLIYIDLEFSIYDCKKFPKQLE